MWLPGAKTDEKSNEAGSTPTTVYGSSFRVRFRPVIPGSAAKRLSHSPWLSSTALGPCHLHSSALNSRPICGSTPSTWKKFPDTGTPLSRSGSPRPVSVMSPTP